jgi:starch phosphorylase
MTIERVFPRVLPSALYPLAELALDLRWNWNSSAKELWRFVDAPLWEATGNPVLILGTIPRSRLNDLANDPNFLEMMVKVTTARAHYLEEPTWFSQNQTENRVSNIAYFSMEFGLSKALPIYSGGLGIVAGDLIKSASDMGLPMVGVGLFYQQGYFRQSIDSQGRQLAFYPFNDTSSWLPVIPATGTDGEWLRINLGLPGRTVMLRVWQVQVGRVLLYLLDSNDPLNDPRDRAITAELYGGGSEQRIQQELVLGMGGWRLLEAIGRVCDVCHLNEGHAAFVVLERARAHMRRNGVDFFTSLCCTRVGNLFTTHTPVRSGFDIFSPQIMRQYMGGYSLELGLDFHEFMALGRIHPDDEGECFNMAWLAMRGSGAVNGVSKLHGEMSKKIFSPLFQNIPLNEIPIGHVTNGVHLPTWSSRRAELLWRKICSDAGWRGDPACLENDFRKAFDTDLWALRCNARQHLVEWLRKRYVQQIMALGTPEKEWMEQGEILNQDVLTLGFARRFVTYKRPNLLLINPDRLERLLTDPHRPVQLVIAGKAHPDDNEGQLLIQEWVKFLERPTVRPHAIFVEDYDMGVASELVHGVDLWINTPLRPWEASGTSGMKVLVNGGLNLSELDGWWAEAYTPEVGWALGKDTDDPMDPTCDRVDAESLYQLLEQQVIPLFYQRDQQGVPQGWLTRMRKSMAHLTGIYSSNRMLREYAEQYYLPAAAALQERAVNACALGKSLHQWTKRVQHHWPQIRIGIVTRSTKTDLHSVTAQIYLDDLQPGDVVVELYAEPIGEDKTAECTPMLQGDALLGATSAWLYHFSFKAIRSLENYTVRVRPFHSKLRLPLELNLICWER